MTSHDIHDSPTLSAQAGRVGEPVRWRRMLAPAATAALVTTTTLALHVRDPHVQGSWGVCPTKWVLGLDCPACGGLRAVHDLTNLDLVAAASSNLLLVLAIPFAIALWLRWALVRWRGVPGVPVLRVPGWAWWVAAAVLVAFTVVRNLPVGAWFAS